MMHWLLHRQRISDKEDLIGREKTTDQDDSSRTGGTVEIDGDGGGEGGGEVKCMELMNERMSDDKFVR